MTIRSFARLTMSVVPLMWAAAAAAATLTPIAPFADPDSTGTGLLGINNAGYTTGNINYADGSALGFVRAPDGTYTTFSNSAYPAGTFTSGRAISNTNMVIGYSSVPGGNSNQFRGFQRLADGTVSLLTHPVDGSFQSGITLNGISQGINDSGAIVGNYRAQATAFSPIRNHGYILNGASFTDLVDPTLAPTQSVNARGIANDGTVVGWTSDNVNGVRGWIYSGGSFDYIRHPLDTVNGALGTTILEAVNNVGQMLGGYSYDDGMGNLLGRAFLYDPITHGFTDIVVPGATNVQTFGINDAGQYVISSDAGQFIYSPDGPTAPDGSPVFNPVSGGDLPPGQAQFAITVVAGQVYYIDPAYASGFEYLSGTGPLFSSVIAPGSIGVNNMFSLYLWNGTDYVFDAKVTGGVEFSFASPTDRFELRGIPSSAGIDPNNPSGFVTGLTFASAGQFNGFQNALTAVPEPATWSLMIAGFGLVGASLRRRARATA